MSDYKKIYEDLVQYLKEQHTSKRTQLADYESRGEPVFVITGIDISEEQRKELQEKCIISAKSFIENEIERLEIEEYLLYQLISHITD